MRVGLGLRRLYRGDGLSCGLSEVLRPRVDPHMGMADRSPILRRPFSRRELVPHVEPGCLGENRLHFAAEYLRRHHLRAGVLDRPVCPGLPP